MQQSHTHTNCAFCQKTLHWWNAETCTRCGKVLCSQHAHMVKRRHSRVLSSICDECVACTPASDTQVVVHQHTLVHAR